MTKLPELLPNLIYNSFTFEFYVDKGNDTEGDEMNSTFKLQGRFSGDQIAGMYLATRAMITSIMFDDEYDYRNMCIHCSSGNYSSRICSSDGDTAMLSFLRHYIRVQIEELTRDIALSEIPDDKYGIWMQNPVTYMYELIVFDSAEFMQGFITICNAFQVDYSDYILGNIVKYDELGNPVLYRIIT